ncbi:MAG: hypothetical protein ACJAQT_000983 [Akkermansiaceae bacterium]|jgi:hypothetical protein
MVGKSGGGLAENVPSGRGGRLRLGRRVSKFNFVQELFL